MSQHSQAFRTRWPLASDALDAIRWEVLQLAYWCETLYFGFMVNPAVPVPWPKDDAPGDVELALEASRATCLAACAPFLPRLRRLYPSGGVKGWNRMAACGVDALVHFSCRLSTQAARLRGVQVADAIGEERFEDIPTLERGYFSAIIEQDFALLRQSEAALNWPTAGRRSEEAKKPALSKDESENKVGDYLKAHKARARLGSVSIREIHQETQVPIASIQGTDAWRALQNRLEQEGRSKRPRPRKAQAFTAAMDSVAVDVELAKLTAEQAADDEGSPLDKGRRGKVRVQKRF